MPDCRAGAGGVLDQHGVGSCPCRRPIDEHDADPAQISDLRQGIVKALIAQEPYQEGVDGVQQAVNALTGKPTQSILTGLTVITKSNLAEIQAAGRGAGSRPQRLPQPMIGLVVTTVWPAGTLRW